MYLLSPLTVSTYLFDVFRVAFLPRAQGTAPRKLLTLQRTLWSWQPHLVPWRDHFISRTSGVIGDPLPYPNFFLGMRLFHETETGYLQSRSTANPEQRCHPWNDPNLGIAPPSLGSMCLWKLTKP